MNSYEGPRPPDPKVRSALAVLSGRHNHDDQEAVPDVYEQLDLVRSRAEEVVATEIHYLRRRLECSEARIDNLVRVIWKLIGRAHNAEGGLKQDKVIVAKERGG